MKYFIVGLNYCCEVDPVLNYLRVIFPELNFTSETNLYGTFSSSWEIFVSGSFDAKELDQIRTIGSVFRDGFSKGFMIGFNDHIKHGA